MENVLFILGFGTISEQFLFSKLSFPLYKEVKQPITLLLPFFG